MRRLFLVATCAAVLLCVAPAASALEAPLHGHPSTPAIHAAAVKQVVQRIPVVFVPLARRVPAHTGVIKLNVYTYDGQPETGAEVRWVVDWGNAVGWDEGSGTTIGGHVELTDVPAADSASVVNAEIVVRPVALPDAPDNAVYYHLDRMSWPAEGYTAGLQPGRLPLTIVRSEQSGYDSWRSVTASLWTVNAGGETHVARTNVAGSPGAVAGTVEGFARTITTGTESLAGGTLYFWQDQGISLPVAGTTVSPGTEASPGQTVIQSEAQRVLMPGWGSGKPGTRTSLGLDNYPAGWVNAIKGQADYPKDAPVNDFGSLTTTGDSTTDAARLIIPSTALPGYKYWVWADRADGCFGLVTSFQTCTLKPSKTAVVRGRTIAVSGVVPIQGHLGSTPGTPKWVTIYRTTSAKVAAKGQPSLRGGATVAGWTKIARVRTDGLGKYRKGSIPVTRSAWYCAWYPHDSWYWGAWTSVSTKVTAR